MGLSKRPARRCLQPPRCTTVLGGVVATIASQKQMQLTPSAHRLWPIGKRTEGKAAARKIGALESSSSQPIDPRASIASCLLLVRARLDYEEIGRDRERSSSRNVKKTRQVSRTRLEAPGEMWSWISADIACNARRQPPFNVPQPSSAMSLKGAQPSPSDVQHLAS